MGCLTHFATDARCLGQRGHRAASEGSHLFNSFQRQNSPTLFPYRIPRPPARYYSNPIGPRFFERPRMTRVAQLLTLLTTLLLIQTVRAAAPAPTITVNVQDPATKTPISGVRISLYGGRSSGDSYTGDDGSAHFQMDLAAGDYIQISASCDGYCPIYWQTNGDTKPPTRFDLLMEKATDIGGIVVDQDGKPLAGARVIGQVNKKYADANLRLAGGYISVLAGDDGKWLASGIPEHFETIALAAYHKECIAGDAFPQPKPFTDIAALRNATASLKLTRGTPVKLLVHGPDGQPIRNARIAFGARRAGPNGYPEEKTDATGTLNLGIKTGTPVTITITAKGYAPELVRQTIGPTPQIVPVNLALGHLLEGTILDGNGDPAVNAQVSIESWRGTQILHPRIRADGDGHFAWPDAPADEVTVYVYTRHGTKGDIKIKAGQENKIQMDPPSHFKGTVVDAVTGKPIADYAIVFGVGWNPGQPINWNSGSDDAELDQDGGAFTATFSQNYPQRAVRVVADGYLPSDSTTFNMSTKETSFAFKLEKGDPIRGMVTAADGKAVSGATVLLAFAGEYVPILNGKPEERALQEIKNTQTGSDGSFTLPPQRDAYLLAVTADAGCAQISRDDLRKSSTVILQPWGRIEGTARRGTKPDASAQIRGSFIQPYEQNKPNVMWQFSATAARDGKFTIEHVRPGLMTLGREVQLSENQSTTTHNAHLTIIPGQTAIATIGGTGRPVIGHIEIPPDVAAAGVAFSDAIIQPTTPQGSREAIQFPIRRDGSFEIDDVPPGNYSLTAQATDPPAPNQWQGGKKIGAIAAKFTIPPIPAGVSDEPLDIGALAIAPDKVTR